MHPAGLVQLPHGRIDDGHAGLPLTPGRKILLARGPGHPLGFGLEWLVAAHPRISHNQVLIKLPPQQFTQPGGRALAATGPTATIRIRCHLHTLANRNRATIQIGREPGRIFLRGVITPAVIVIDDFGKRLQSLRSGRFTHRPVKHAPVITGRYAIIPYRLRNSPHQITVAIHGDPLRPALCVLCGAGSGGG